MAPCSSKKSLSCPFIRVAENKKCKPVFQYKNVSNSIISQYEIGKDEHCTVYTHGRRKKEECCWYPCVYCIDVDCYISGIYLNVKQNTFILTKGVNFTCNQKIQGFANRIWNVVFCCLYCLLSPSGVTSNLTTMK